MHYLAVNTINQDLVTVFSGDPSHERCGKAKGVASWNKHFMLVKKEMGHEETSQSSLENNQVTKLPPIHP